jgi:hypothetical protein
MGGSCENSRDVTSANNQYLAKEMSGVASWAIFGSRNLSGILGKKQAIMK